MRVVSVVVALTVLACSSSDDRSIGDEPGGDPVLVAEEIVSEEDGVSAIVADEDRIYYTSWGGRLWSADPAGEDVVLLADTTAYRLAADASHLYWTTDRDIRRVRKAGGRPQIVASLRDTSNGLAAALWLAVDREFVYASTYDHGAVVRAPKAGGELETVTQTDGTMGPIDVVGDRLYWAEYGWSGPIVEQNLATAQQRTLGSSGATNLRVIDGALWVTEAGDLGATLVRIPLDGTAASRFRGADVFFGYDGSHVYWMSDRGELARIDPATTETETMTVRVPGSDLEDMAIAGGWVFLTDGSYPGGIYRLPAAL